MRRFSQPYGRSRTFRELTVDGPAGEERLHIADDGGHITRISVAGENAAVLGVAIPGPGEPITTAVDSVEMHFAADSSGRLYQSKDGRRWRGCRLVTQPVSSLAVVSDGLLAVTRDGTVYIGIRDFNDPADRVEALPDGVRPHDAAGAGRTAAIVGTDGNLLLRPASPRFERVNVDTTIGLAAVALDSNEAVVAVGMDGTIVEGTDSEGGGTLCAVAQEDRYERPRRDTTGNWGARLLPNGAPRTDRHVVH